jgi:hypothetical protein
MRSPLTRFTQLRRYLSKDSGLVILESQTDCAGCGIGDSGCESFTFLGQQLGWCCKGNLVPVLEITFSPGPLFACVFAVLTSFASFSPCSSTFAITLRTSARSCRDRQPLLLLCHACCDVISATMPLYLGPGHSPALCNLCHTHVSFTSFFFLRFASPVLHSASMFFLMRRA